ncbi:MAG: iron-sulfur cluster assembly accessory protein [Pseudomonadota bacterium]
MITLTPEAIKQVLVSAEQNGVSEAVLRLAAKQNPDGSLQYGMGFDEAKDDDMAFNFQDVTVVFNGEYGPLLNGATIDFVEMEPGQHNFIFINPNDTNCSQQDSSGGGCSSGGCGGCS